jgi:hypothetical protein
VFVVAVVVNVNIVLYIFGIIVDVFMNFYPSSLALVMAGYDA